MHFVRLIAIALVMFGALVACGGAPAGPLAVDSVTFKRADTAGNAGETVSAFKPADHKIFAVAKLNQVVDNFNGKAVWTAVQTSEGNDIKIAEAPLAAAKADTLSTDLSLPQDWPTGKYKVDFYSGDMLLKSQDFAIQ